MKRHVALVGFMAAGKSTIGRRLARELGCPFFDTDDLVTQEHGSVASIFEREGEDAFRRYESAAIAAALNVEEGGVVALGGGALKLPENRRMLRHRAYRVFLKVSPEQVLHRINHSRVRRPLLGAKPTLPQIRDLYEERLPLYASADLVVEADRRNAREILDEIVEWLREKRNAPAG